MDKKRVLTSKMNLELKKRIMRCLIWSVALYAAETWKLTKADVRRLEAFEMWIWQRVERISWVDKISKEEVLAKVEEDRQIMKIIQQRQRHWFGHILRHDSLLLDVIKVWMKGRPTRERRLQLLHMLAKDGYVAIKWETEDRWGWSQRTPCQKRRILDRERVTSVARRVNMKEGTNKFDATTFSSSKWRIYSPHCTCCQSQGYDKWCWLQLNCD